MISQHGEVIFKELRKKGGALKAEDLDNNFRRFNLIDGEEYTVTRTDDGNVMNYVGIVTISEGGFDPETGEPITVVSVNYRDGGSETHYTKMTISPMGSFLGWFVR
jgi:hypothetical protein